MSKFVLTFKDPDGIYDQFMDAAEDLGVDQEVLMEFAEKWTDGEYLSVEFDMEDGSVSVIEEE
jgi:hypothetical protein